MGAKPAALPLSRRPQRQEGRSDETLARHAGPARCDHCGLLQKTEYLRVTWAQREHDHEALAATNFDNLIDMIREPLQELRRTQLEPPPAGGRPSPPTRPGGDEAKTPSPPPGAAKAKMGPCKGR